MADEPIISRGFRGRRPPSDRERRMSDILGSDGTVRVTSTLEAVDQVAHEFADRSIEILAICGGDGSDHCTLTAFHRVYAGRPLPLLFFSGSGSGTCRQQIRPSA